MVRKRLMVPNDSTGIEGTRLDLRSATHEGKCVQPESGKFGRLIESGNIGRSDVAFVTSNRANR